MLLNFIRLEWRNAIRSPMWQKNVILNIVIGFFLLFFVFYLLLLGIFMDELLGDLFPDRNKLELINGTLIYYFLFDLVVRFLMQPLPRMAIESFLHLPVGNKKLVHYMIIRTLPDVFNLIPLFILIPVTFTIVTPYAGAAGAVRWILSLFILILANDFFAVFLKRMLGARPVLVGVAALILLGIITMDRFDILSVSGISSTAFSAIVYNTIILIVPLVWLICAYFLQYRFLSAHLYPDEVQVRKRVEYGQEEKSRYLRSLGLTGTVLSLEYKLYLRNKRTRTIIYLLPVFLLYGLLFYPNEIYMKEYSWLMFVGVFMTGGVMLNYANYAFGYESGYFDALLTKNLDIAQYIRIKHIICLLISTCCYILTVPYVLFGLKILLINTAMYLYNIGILSFVLLYFATFNKKRLDLTRGGAFNYQGIGAMNWLAVLPAFLLPVLILIPFNIAGVPEVGIIFTGMLGVIGLFFSGIFIKLIARNFYRRKYIMAHCFREK